MRRDLGPTIETAWSKAQACDTHARLTKDENLRAKFERLRDSWIRIANDAEIASATRNSERPAPARSWLPSER
jgi:hypothetical protein